jgi:hypothetical protein
MPLSTDEFLLTRKVVAGEIAVEPTAISIRCILEVSPCGSDPGWSDVVLTNGEEWTIATAFGELVPTSRTP